MSQPIFKINVRSIILVIEAREREDSSENHRWGYKRASQIIDALLAEPSNDGWILYSRAVEIIRGFRCNEMVKDADLSIDAILRRIKEFRVR